MKTRLRFFIFFLFVSNLASAQTIDLLSFNIKDHEVAIDSVQLFEDYLMQQDGAEVQDIAFSPAYFKGRQLVFDLPQDIQTDHLPRSSARLRSWSSVQILESYHSYIVVIPQSYRKITTGLLKHYKNLPKTSDIRPSRLSLKSAKLAKFKTIENDTLQVLTLPRSLSSASKWHATSSAHYRVSFGDKSYRVAFFAKPNVTVNKMYRGLMNTRRQLTNAIYVPFSTLRPLSFSGMPEEELYKFFKKLGSNFVPLRTGDLKAVPDLQKAFPKFGLDSLKLLSTNLTDNKGEAIEWVKPYVVVKRQGVKIAFFSLMSPDSNAYLKRLKSPYKIQNDVASLKKFIKVVDEKEDVDLKVLVYFTSPEDRAKLLQQVSGIDIVMGDLDATGGTKKHKDIRLEGWKTGRRDYVALQATHPYNGLNKIRLNFQKKGSGYQLRRVREKPIWTWQLSETETPFSEFYNEHIRNAHFSKSEMALPDARKVWPEAKEESKYYYHAEEFWEIIAKTLKKEMNAEAAFVKVVGIGHTIGNYQKDYLSNQFYTSDSVLMAKAYGSTLRKMAAHIVRPKPPVIYKAGDYYKYSEELYVAGAGLSSKQRINGASIRNAEVYHIAVTKSLLEQKDKHPFLAEIFGVKDAGIHVDDLTLEALKNLHAKKEAKKKKHYQKNVKAILGDSITKYEDNTDLAKLVDKELLVSKQAAARVIDEEYYATIRKLAQDAEKPRPNWRLNLRKLKAYIQSVNLENNTNFTQVQDQRIRSVDQLAMNVQGELFSEFSYDRFLWDTGVKAAFGKVILKPDGVPEIENETQDDLIFEADLGYQLVDLNALFVKQSFGPFFKMSYNTEFTKEENLAKKKLLALKPGLRFFPGPYIQNLSANAIIEKDFTRASQTSTEYGYEMNLTFQIPVKFPRMVLTSETNYVYFFDADDDTADDLQQTLETNVALSVPLIGNLRLSPFLNFYLFEGKVVEETGTSLTVGVSLDFSHLWKPIH